MYQIINEPIAVAGVFKSNPTSTFQPTKFLWKNHSYTIEEITLQSNLTDGGIRKRYYSVMAQNNLYRLCFNRENESWSLEEVWCD